MSKIKDDIIATSYYKSVLTRVGGDLLGGEADRAGDGEDGDESPEIFIRFIFMARLASRFATESPSFP